MLTGLVCSGHGCPMNLNPDPATGIVYCDYIPLLRTVPITDAELDIYENLRERMIEITKDLPLIINGKTYINGELQC